MPTYEYKCPEGHHFELFQKMTEDPRGICPECGAESERQISGGAGFLFKGDGFYITDYRSESYKKEASKEKTDGVVEKGTDKKPKKQDSQSSPRPAAASKSDSSSSSGGRSQAGGSSSGGGTSSKRGSSSSGGASSSGET